MQLGKHICLIDAPYQLPTGVTSLSSQARKLLYYIGLCRLNSEDVVSDRGMLYEQTSTYEVKSFTV